MAKSKDLVLNPLTINRRFEDLISDEIFFVLKSEFLNPLKLALLENEKIKNSKDGLLKAIRSGRIVFQSGVFRGKRNSVITEGLREIGAKFDRKSKNYKISKSQLTPEILSAISVSKNNIQKRLDKINKAFDSIDPEKIAAKVSLTSIYNPFLKDVSNRFKDNVDGLKIEKKLTAEQLDNIARDYSNNMQKYIKDWTEEEIKKFRKIVQKNVNTGLRYEELQKNILKKGLTNSKAKARFWARQETNLLTVQYQIEQFKEIGVKKYIWTTVNGSPNHPVRPRHKELEGMIISLDKPPIVDYKTGRRAHAGQDFNCRCRMKPLIQAE